MRQYTFAAPAAINQFALATDDVTGLSVQQLNKDNAIIDYVNAIDPPTGEQFQSQLFINNLQSGPTFFSTNSSSASAGLLGNGISNVTFDEFNDCETWLVSASPPIKSRNENNGFKSCAEPVPIFPSNEPIPPPMEVKEEPKPTPVSVRA